MTPAARARLRAERLERLGLNPDAPPRHHPACPFRLVHRCVPVDSAVDPDCECVECAARFAQATAAQRRLEAAVESWVTRRASPPDGVS